MARSDPQVNLRIPADLKDDIDAAAKTNGRSMNAEVVARLSKSFDPPLTDEGLMDLYVEVKGQNAALQGFSQSQTLLLRFLSETVAKAFEALSPKARQGTEVRTAALFNDAIRNQDNTLLFEAMQGLFDDSPEVVAGLRDWLERSRAP